MDKVKIGKGIKCPGAEGICIYVVDKWGKSFPSRKNSKNKGAKAGEPWACLGDMGKGYQK